MFDSNDEQDHLRVIGQLDGQACAVTLAALDLFMTISAIQLALRHPEFPAHIRDRVEQTALTLVRALAFLPKGSVDQDTLLTILMLGFDPSYDQPGPKGAREVDDDN